MKSSQAVLLLCSAFSLLIVPAACSNNDSVNGDGGSDSTTGGLGGGSGDGDGDSGVGGDGLGAVSGDGDSGGSAGAGDGDGAGGGINLDCDVNGVTCSNGSDCCSGYCNGDTDTCSCAAVGKACTNGGECCSGQCNPSTNTCALVLGACAEGNSPCGDSSECCSLSCVDGSCSEDACAQDDQACSVDGECCGGKCDGGSCAVINSPAGASCKTSGNSCDDSSDCCSGLCGDDGVCKIGSSYCVQTSDVCTSDSQCCQGTCKIADGDSAGYCAIQESSGTRCGSRKIAGEVCGGDCAECCSRTCAPFGPTGITICQPPTGCRTDGELCRSVNDCCGGNPDSTVPGAGEAQCLRVNPDDEVGRCKVGACNPDGAICGSPDDGTAACDGSLSAPNGQKCCGTKLPDWDGENACVADSLLVPRCSTIPGECVEGGGDCATADDCCGGTPCVQNNEGRFVCYDPPGDATCVSSGGPCTANADCCVGSQCLSQPGQATGVCGENSPPGSGGGSSMGGAGNGDGGSGQGTGSSDSGTGGGSNGGGDGGGSTTVCAEFGQSCAVNADCCGDVPCDPSSNTCRYPIR